MTETTPGIALTAASARCRTGSQACTTAALTVDREEHLAVGDQNVGKHTSLGERHPVRTAHRFEARQDLVLDNAISHSMTAAGQTPRGRIVAST